MNARFKDHQVARPNGRQRLIALVGALFVSLTILIAPVRSSYPALPVNDPFAGVEVLQSGDLLDMRGGIRTEFGMDINLGANIQTLVNGHLVLETIATLTDSGLTTETVTSNVAELTALGGALEGLVAMDSHPNLTVPDGFEGIILSDGDGIVAGLTNIGPNQISNLVTAIGQTQTISQGLTLSIDISGFSNAQQTAQQSLLGAGILDSVQSSVLGALGR